MAFLIPYPPCTHVAARGGIRERRNGRKGYAVEPWLSSFPRGPRRRIWVKRSRQDPTICTTTLETDGIAGCHAARVGNLSSGRRSYLRAKHQGGVQTRRHWPAPKMSEPRRSGHTDDPQRADGIRFFLPRWWWAATRGCLACDGKEEKKGWQPQSAQVQMTGRQRWRPRLASSP